MGQDISYKTIMNIALPIMVSGLGHAVLMVTDTAFLGRVSEVAIGAAGNAGLFYYILVVIGMGFSTGTQIILGRRNGEGNHQAIGSLFMQSLYFLLPVSMVFFAFIKLGSPVILSQIVKSVNILDTAVIYLNYRSWGIFFSLINLVFVAFYVGITKTRVLSWSTSFMVAVNIILDYCLIFGAFGFPELGVQGAALASVIAEAATTLFFVVYTLLMVDKQKYGMFKPEGIRIKSIGNILNVGGPVMVQNFISLSAWFIFFSIIEHLGERELAISQIIRSVYMTLMIPVFALGDTTSTLTSNLIGQDEHNRVLPLIRRVLGMGFIANVIMLQASLFFPEEIISVFSPDQSLVVASIPTLYVINGAMFVFSFALIVFRGLTGTGNTRIALLIESINMVIYLTFTYVIVMKYQVAVELAWCSEFLYFSLLAIMSWGYLQRGNWRSVNV